MNSTREKSVKDIFDLIDYEKFGIIDIEKMLKFYDEEKHPEVIIKKISA